MAFNAPIDGYESSSESETSRTRPRHFVAPSGSPGPMLLPSGCSSFSSTASSTPLPSRSSSPLPLFYISHPNTSSCTSDTDCDPNPLSRDDRRLGWRDARRGWWSVSRRRRKRSCKFTRFIKKWTRRVIRHPFFPSQPMTIVLTLILFCIFSIFLTLLLMYVLNPDKEPLPWRAYCTAPSLSLPYDSLPSSSSPVLTFGNLSLATTAHLFPPSNLDSLSPVGLFIGVFSIDSEFERRMLVRTTWANHPRSRDGAGDGDNGFGTSRTIVRFILGQPRKDWERRIKLEMEMYNDIVILPIVENMNGGKTHTFFSWASINAWVPPIYTNHTRKRAIFSYSNYTASPPSLAPHDSVYAWQDHMDRKFTSWVRPDYVIKVDDDSFVMLAELESRLRVELYAPRSRPRSLTPHSAKRTDLIRTNQSHGSLSERSQPLLRDSVSDPLDPLIYWGYLVTNRLHKFMAGELYALSWNLVEWVAKDPVVKGFTKGAEDKQTAKWMKLHPRASEVRWASERCWIYDHPRAGTVYAHGFLYPSEATRIKRSLMASLDKARPQDTDQEDTLQNVISPTPSSWAYSSVSTFGVRYSPPLPDLSTPHSVEALVEGSDMSMIREGSPMTPDYAWVHREGRQRKYEGNRVGGTVVVHFIKKHMWFLETAFAFLEGEEYSEAEEFQSDELAKAARSAIPQPSLTRWNTRPRPRPRHRY